MFKAKTLFFCLIILVGSIFISSKIFAQTASPTPINFPTLNGNGLSAAANYRLMLENLGVDPDKIMAGDKAELAKLEERAQQMKKIFSGQSGIGKMNDDIFAAITAKMQCDKITVYSLEEFQKIAAHFDVKAEEYIAYAYSQANGWEKDATRRESIALKIQQYLAEYSKNNCQFTASAKTSAGAELGHKIKEFFSKEYNQNIGLTSQFGQMCDNIWEKIKCQAKKIFGKKC